MDLNNQPIKPTLAALFRTPIPFTVQHVEQEELEVFLLLITYGQ